MGEREVKAGRKEGSGSFVCVAVGCEIVCIRLH